MEQLSYYDRLHDYLSVFFLKIHSQSNVEMKHHFVASKWTAM